MTYPHEIEEQRETEGPVDGAAHVVAVDQLVQTSSRTEIVNQSRTFFVAQTPDETVHIFVTQRTQLDIFIMIISLSKITFIVVTYCKNDADGLSFDFETFQRRNGKVFEVNLLTLRRSKCN